MKMEMVSGGLPIKVLGGGDHRKRTSFFDFCTAEMKPGKGQKTNAV